MSLKILVSYVFYILDNVIENFNEKLLWRYYLGLFNFFFTLKLNFYWFICRVDIQLTGTYKICFDNTFSRFFRKVVYFDIITENEDDEIDNRNWTFSKDDAAELMEIKLEDFKVSFFFFLSLHTSWKCLDEIRDLEIVFMPC